MGGGKSKPQKQAEQAQANLANTQAGIAQQQNALQLPFIQSRIEGGLPFLDQMLDFEGGTTARAFAPARGALNRRLSQFSEGLPSGFREQALGDFESNRARAFDDQVVRALMLDEETRARAAGMLNPLGFFSGASGANQSILAQPQRQGFGSVVGGALSGLLGGVCWVAFELYPASDAMLIRAWLLEHETDTVWGRLFVGMYRRFGQRWAGLVRHSNLIRDITKRLFDRFLVHAKESQWDK